MRGIVIDITPINNFFNLPLDVMAERLLYNFGWIPIAIALLWGMKEVWLFYIRQKWGALHKHIFLAIDIPKGNEQTPKAVENIFTYLAGAHSSINLLEKYWEGKFQLFFSLETVSIDGYTQFIIRTPIYYRNLVESAIYSQYPDAEITEVNDYTEGIPTKFPDDEYDIFGAEFIQAENPAYPIKTYIDFEHSISEPGEQFKDPMASLMDLCSSLRKGEQLWYQIILIPIGFSWPEIGEKEVAKVLGEKVKRDGLLDKIFDAIDALIGGIGDIFFGGEEEKKVEQVEDDRFKMMGLKPREKKKVEAITEKTGKLGFEFKIRFLYVAKKEILNKPKVSSGFVGFMKQFAALDLNNLKPDMDITATKTDYFFKEYRLNVKKNKIMRNYVDRKDWAGKKPGILNIEELATIWHFPVEAVVKAPLIQKAPGRKSEPPMTLPMGEEVVSEEIFETDVSKKELDEIFIEPERNDIENKEKGKKEMKEENIFKEDIKDSEVKIKGSPPGNLPFA